VIVAFCQHVLNEHAMLCYSREFRKFPMKPNLEEWDRSPQIKLDPAIKPRKRFGAQSQLWEC